MSPAPKVAFFPGASGDGEFWRPVADRLPPGWTKTLLNWPGAGDQLHDPRVRGFEDLIELAADTLDDQSDVIAQSMGGIVAIGVALRHPEKLRRLVLVATSGGIDVAALGGTEWREEYRAEYPNAAPWISNDDLHFTDGIDAIRAPTLLVWGDSDPISPVAVGQRLADLLSNSKLHVLPAGTHQVAHDRPDEVAALILGHIA